MSATLIHTPIVVLELFTVIQLVRFWKALYHRGFFDPAIRRFHTAFLADCMVLFIFAVQLLLALHDWMGLPLTELGIHVKSTAVLTWLVFAWFMAWVWMHCRGRLDYDSPQRAIAALALVSVSMSRIQL